MPRTIRPADVQHEIERRVRGELRLTTRLGRTAAEAYAKSAGRSVRTIRRWRKEERASAPRPRRGRPPASEDVRRRARMEVCREAKRQTLAAGEAAIHAAVKERGVSRRQVRSELQRVKRLKRRRDRRGRAARRRSVQVLATGALVGQDATFCGRHPPPAGRRVGRAEWLEVQRDVASTKTVGLRRGPAADGPEIVRQLEALRGTRGELPLVIALDRGAQYENEDVKRYLDDHEVVLLPRLPRTPQHNAWSERGIRELKDAAPLDAGMPPAVQEARLRAAAARLDANRRHATRKGLTADEAYSILPRATSLVPRATFYADCRRAMQDAEHGHDHQRAKTLASRLAVLRVMESYGLVKITGGRPTSTDRPSVPT